MIHIDTLFKLTNNSINKWFTLTNDSHSDIKFSFWQMILIDKLFTFRHMIHILHMINILKYDSHWQKNSHLQMIHIYILFTTCIWITFWHMIHINKWFTFWHINLILTYDLHSDIWFTFRHMIHILHMVNILKYDSHWHMIHIDI